MADFYKINPLVLVGTPTLQKIGPRWEWLDAYSALQIPLGAAHARLRIYNEYVADARNILAQRALEQNCDWLLFIGDDNIVPPNIFELLSRHKKKLVTGVYWTKSYPHMPYIWRDLMKGPYTDWKYGEFFKVDWAGCDTLLVHTDVFRAIPFPWFSHDWTFTEAQGSVPLATEDLYFYTKTKQAGFELWCDSACQCLHQDRDTGVAYGLTQDMPQFTGSFAVNIPDEKKKMVADIGCGFSTPTFENAIVRRYDINADVKPDVRCDVRAIPEADETFDIVRAHHVLEHFFFYEARDILKEWTRILKVDGEIHIYVPNIGFAAEEILKTIENPNHDATYAFGMIYGTRPDIKASEHDHNQIHRMGFTVHGLRRLLETFDFLGEIEVTEGHPGSRDGKATLFGKAVKVKSSKPFRILNAWNETVNNGSGKLPSVCDLPVGGESFPENIEAAHGNN